jgi:hypothetical protein
MAPQSLGAAAQSAVEQVLCLHELLALIIGPVGWRGRSVCEAWREAYDGGTRPKPHSLIVHLSNGTWSQSLELAGDNMPELLALRTCELIRYPSARHFVFAPAMVRRILNDHGGIHGLAARVCHLREEARLRRNPPTHQGTSPLLMAEAEERHSHSADASTILRAWMACDAEVVSA